MIGPEAKKYREREEFVAHATTFENHSVFFGRHHEVYTGPQSHGVKGPTHTAWLGKDIPSVEDQKAWTHRFAERVSWLNGPLRRKQMNNRQPLTGQIFSVADSLEFKFQGLYEHFDAKTAARMNFEALIDSYHRTYWDVGKDAVIRRGAGGKYLVAGEQSVAVAFHSVNFTGGKNSHLHVGKNGTAFDRNDRPGAIKLEKEYGDDRLEQELFQLHLANYCRGHFGWNVEIANGKAVVPGVTKKMCHDAGLGSRAQAIRGYLTKLGIPVTWISKRIANRKTRENPPKIFTLAERAPVWAKQYRHAVKQNLNWGPEPPKPVFSPGRFDAPDFVTRRKQIIERSERQFEKALKPGYWQRLSLDYSSETLVLSTQEQLAQFVRDTSRASLWQAHRAALRGAQWTHAFDVLGFFASAERAFAEARKAKFTPTKDTSVFVGEELSKQLRPNMLEWLDRLSRRTGCAVEYMNHPWLAKKHEHEHEPTHKR